MEFLTLAKMKKKYYHVDACGKYEPNKLIDFEMLDTCADFSGLPEALQADIKRQIAQNLVSVCDLSYCVYTYNGRRVYIDLDFDITNVYSQNGRRIYRAYSCRGLRVSVYDSRFYNSMPVDFYFIGQYAAGINNSIQEYTISA